MAKLTAKQSLFVHHYLDTLNATKAAKRAGYKGSYGTLRVVGSENLAKPNIKAAIAEGMKELTMPREEVLRRLSAMAEGIIPSRISETKDGPMAHKEMIRAAEILAKHHGILAERVEQSGEVTIRVEYADPDAPETPYNPEADQD